jgi:WD40 repeat protein
MPSTNNSREKLKEISTSSFLQGVLCYDFCHELDILATGSMDHTVRLWNPYVPSKPVAQLTVHTTSILDVVIAKEMGLIFSFSQDSVSVHFYRSICISWKDGISSASVQQLRVANRISLQDVSLE